MPEQFDRVTERVHLAAGGLAQLQPKRLVILRVPGITQLEKRIHPGRREDGMLITNLDEELRSRGIQFLFFCGITTNVCVETTLRHAFVLDYWPILLRDAAMPAGPHSMHEATVFNVESFFGWTINADDFESSLRAS